MVQVKHIRKFRGKSNKIYDYKLVDINVQTQNAKAEEINNAIRNKQTQVINLTLAED